MKKFLLYVTALFALVIATASTHAQGFSAYGHQIVLPGGTNSIAADTTNSYGNLLSLSRQREWGVQISFRSVGTNTSTIKFNIHPSLDGTTIDMANEDCCVSVAANGTNTVTFITNMTCGAIGYLKLDSVVNPNSASAITNLAFSYSIKR